MLWSQICDFIPWTSLFVGVMDSKMNGEIFMRHLWINFWASLCGMLLARSAASNSSNSGGQSLRDPRSTGHWFNKFNPLKDLKVKATASSKEKKYAGDFGNVLMVNPQFFRGKYQYLMVAVHHIQAPLEQCLNPGWLMIIEDYNTQLCHTQLCHTQLCHTQLCHTPSFTYNFVKHNFVTHHLSHNFDTTLSHTIFHIPLCHTPSFCMAGMVHSLCVAGVALVALGWLWWRAWAWAPLVAGDATVLCVAGVAIGDIHLRFAWQVWRLVTSTFSIHSLCVEGVALMALGWLWWRAWAPLVAGDAAALCMASVALASFSCALPYTIFPHIIVPHTSFTHNFIAHNCSHTTFFNFSILHQLLCLSFLPRAATTIVSAYWKKLTYGVIRSFIVFSPHPILGMDNHSLLWIFVIITRK